MGAMRSVLVESGAWVLWAVWIDTGPFDTMTENGWVPRAEAAGRGLDPIRRAQGRLYTGGGAVR